MILASEIRQKYLDFFRSKNHAIIPSSPLVPENDPSVLFNTAGMQPLVPYLLGEPHPLGKRLADAQKCVRTGDIDDVGDNTHLTFFEMLGNWSLGDYFKKESIEMSWEFLTSSEWLGLDPEMISVTVFEGDQNAPRDEESAIIWKNIGMPEARIAYLPAGDNWWAAGPTGPCGPDTEIFYWMGEGKPPRGSNVGNDPKKWMEIWNNVFMQYNRVDENTLDLLPAPCVDTGMGIERCTVTLNHFSSVYETDLFAPVLIRIKEIVGEAQYNERSARIIADHLRAATHMISDGVVPKNVDQGYILRRLIRRAIREAYKMGYEKPFTAQIANMYIEQFTSIYESIRNNAEKIRTELHMEEERFGKTIKQGLRELIKIVDKKNSSSESKYLQQTTGRNDIGSNSNDFMNLISGKEAFDLFQTYGFPPEMLKEELAQYGMSFHEGEFKETFDDEFRKHQEKSRTAAAGKFVGGLGDHSDETIALHSACHLMLAGLRKVLGESVHQAGSNITAERLRFDFTYGEKMTDEQKQAVEDYVNEAIQSGLTVTMDNEPKEEARASGVEGSFWEKYPDVVKVYSMVGANGVTYSRELCGGPHVENSKTMGVFKIQKEESSSAGVRRIKAVLIK
ncbi:alanine--tRNA ligase [Candidatus Gracilibacteria bacterium]|nr:alanine--tRNA ligase [Candidatus Gracilibacteria bacterium]